MKVPAFVPDNLGRKWVACFDLLGTSANRNPISLFDTYKWCLSEASSQAEGIENVDIAWFSDTFLFYTQDDSRSSLCAVEAVARFFFDELICADLPVRGALACDQFYADRAGNVYLGDALVEAYRCAEKYNWLGFVLSGSAQRGMDRVGRPASNRACYKNWRTEFKEGFGFRTEEVVAYLPGPESIRPVVGENPYLEAVQRMAGAAPAEYQRKYQNTVAFLRHFELVRTG
jgi:hypothetical protein